MDKPSWWNWACAALLLCTATATSSAQTFQTLASFNGTNGANPQTGSLVQGTDGNFYGTTGFGGAYNGGTVFKVTPEGTLTTLYGFCMQSNCTDGSEPTGGLALATDGNFYGTTSLGGASASLGGSDGYGEIFKITSTGQLTTIYSFCDQITCSDGTTPIAGLVQGTDRNFYGTTNIGGAYGYGTVFKVTSGGVSAILYSFTGASDGAYPYAGLMQATDGSFYGTTTGGGTTTGVNGSGTVFQITLAGRLKTIYTFCQTNCGDGRFPTGALVQATDGYFYGTTQSGGSGGYGTVFRITAAGALATLYSFAGAADGAYPIAGLVQGTDGNLYGTTSANGAYGGGTIFQITPEGVPTTLYSFCSQTSGTFCTDGYQPYAGLVQGTDGSFYGTTPTGGPSDAGNSGIVFRLSVGLGPFVETLPTSGNVGTTVQILGTNLTGATSVSFNGTPASFTVVSPSLISTTVPAGAHRLRPSHNTWSHALEQRGLLVGLGPVNATPTITSLSPPSAPAGGPAFTLTVSGTNFTSGAAIQWNGTALLTTLNSLTQLTAPVSAGLIASVAPVSITVASGGQTSAPMAFTINSASSAITFTANPNPIVTTNGATVGKTTLSWNAPGYTRLAVFVNSPTGIQMTGTAGSTGSATTGNWVTNGTQFFLVDLNANSAIASVTVQVTVGGSSPPPPGITFTANPNPIVTTNGAILGKTTLSWNAPGYNQLAVFVDSPTGAQMTGTKGSTGTATTGNWVADGTQFFLVDLSTKSSIASVTVHVTVGGSSPPPPGITFTANPNPIITTNGATLGKTTLSWNAPGYNQLAVFVDSPTGAQMTGTKGSTGTATTGNWVADGTQFFLVDLSTKSSIASVTVHVTVGGSSPPPPGITFTANPNPIITTNGATVGKTTLSWSAPGYSDLAVFVNSVTGTQMTGTAGSVGSAPTGNWVTDGTQFFLVNLNTGIAIASLTVHVTSSGTGTPASMPIISGNAQTAQANQPFAAPLVVAVLDSQGNPLTGVPVTWEITKGSGNLSNTSASTGAGGQAATNVTGTAVGPLVVTASAGSTSAQFDLTVASATSYTSVVISSSGQNVANGTDSSYAITADTTGETAVPAPATVVTSLPSGWAVVPGAAWIAPAADQSNATRNPCCSNTADTYQTTFTVSGDPSNVALNLTLAADDYVDIKLNGSPVFTHTNTSMWGAPITVPISSGFVSGTNTLDFFVTNGGGPTGLAVAVTSVISGVAQVAPAQTFNFAGTFDTSASTTTTVVFSDNAGYQVSIPALTVATNSISALVPPYLNTQQGQITSGSVTAWVTQQPASGAGTTTNPVSLQIAALPQTGASPGSITLYVITQLAQLAATANQTWSTIGTESGGAVNVSQLNLPGLQSDLSAAQAQIQALVSGTTSQINLGLFGGNTVTLDMNGLALLDQLFYAYYLGSIEAPSQANSALRRAVLLAGQRPRQAGDVPTDFQNFFTNSLTSTNPQSVLYNVRHARNWSFVIGAVMTVAVLGGATVSAPVVVAAVVVGTVFTVSQAELIALQNGGSYILQNPPDTVDFQNVMGAVGDVQPPQLTDPTGDGGGQVEDDVTNDADNIEPAIDPNNPNGVTAQTVTAATENLFNAGYPFTGSWTGSYSITPTHCPSFSGELQNVTLTQSSDGSINGYLVITNYPIYDSSCNVTEIENDGSVGGIGGKATGTDSNGDATFQGNMYDVYNDLNFTGYWNFTATLSRGVITGTFNQGLNGSFTLHH